MNNVGSPCLDRSLSYAYAEPGILTFVRQLVACHRLGSQRRRIGTCWYPR